MYPHKQGALLSGVKSGDGSDGKGERVVMTLIAMVVVLAVVLCWGNGDEADCEGNGIGNRIVLRDW